MRLLPNFRARLEKALGERLDEWRPGGTAPDAPSDRESDAAFVADAEPAADAEPVSRPSSRPGATDYRSAPASPPSSRGETDAGSRAALLARLRGPDALREAFVVKEILDRPVSLRSRRGRGIPS